MNEQLAAAAAPKPVAWSGMLLTIAAPALVAMQPALPALVAAYFPPAWVAIIVAGLGGMITALSAKARETAPARAAA